MNAPLAEWLILLVAIGLASMFKPWQCLRRAELQHPWLAALVIVPWLWNTQHQMPGELGLHLSGACLMVLMFGWPLTIMTMIPIGIISALLADAGPHWLGGHASTTEAAAAASAATPALRASAAIAADTALRSADTGARLLAAMLRAVADVVWSGVIPATLALGLGAAIRRWLPRHLFVYILARGFVATALAMTLTAALQLAWLGTADNVRGGDMMIGRWLMSWGEAFATGMFTAIFVAFAPKRLLTYSDEQYLRP